MLFKLLRFLRLFLPLGLILWIYKNKNSIPTQLMTNSGRRLRACMLTTDYGILILQDKYIEDKMKKLKDKQKLINKQNEELAKEFNLLSFEARESLFSNPGEDK